MKGLRSKTSVPLLVNVGSPPTLLPFYMSLNTAYSTLVYIYFYTMNKNL